MTMTTIMTWKPVNQRHWTYDKATLFGYMNPYNARRTPHRPPDAMVMKIGGIYKCAVGPDWNQDFIAECFDGDLAMHACQKVLIALNPIERTAMKTPTRRA